MYTSRTACSRCSSQLRSASASASAKRLGAVSSYSTAAEVPDIVGTISGSHPGNTGKKPKARQNGPRKGVNAFKHGKNSSTDPALALFKEIVSPKSADTVATTNSAGVPIPVLNELEIVAQLNELMVKGVDPETRFKTFQEEIWPSIRERTGPIPKPIYIAATQLLRSERDYMIQNGLYHNSVEIAQKYSALGIFDLSIRNDLVLNMCARITQQKNTSFQRGALKEEILKMWQHISQLKRPSEFNKPLRFALPSVADVDKDIKYVRDDLPALKETQATRALASMFLQYPPPQAQEIIPSLLATLAITSDQRFSGLDYAKQISPLLNLVRSVSKYRVTGADIDTIVSKSSTVPPARLSKLREYVTKQWPLAETLIAGEVTPWAKGTFQGRDPEAKNTLTHFHRQLREAYRARNPGAVGAIWHAMTNKLQDNPGLKTQLAKDSDFLDFWIFVWCAIRRPARVQETVDLMRSLEVEPTVKTYTSMMHGWKMCKDIGKIEALWSQLVKAGIKLDAVIWTERVSALIELGQHQKGLEALTELVGNWQEAVKKGTQAQAVEPSIEAINAAFKGLLHKDPTAAHQLLAWAGQQGLSPNTRTYNILIRETIRMGHNDDVNELLRSMQKEGVDPDSATFTILLEAVIGRMEDASADEQVAAIKSVFGDIEKAGLKPNLETYGKMLYALDGLPNCSDDVIAALQQHMRSNGFGSVLTPHMITILIERALRRDPPDINKIRSLLRDNKLTKVSTGDQTLWERVMTAHAISGGTKEAMSIFDDLAASGRPVTSLSCLNDLMHALLEKGDIDSAKRVVGVVLKHKLHDREDKEANERYWRHHFWYLAQHNGLIDSQKLRQYARA
ncbi:hypothetical protein BKA59DRAFT_464210 [Fusarium tricinctum]|uniref:Uncharacterized protein n=1 Tax=Fusarium tricinctum TaxID=61284 RepID=A0A8K0WI68_9HYPO|nr:hypothetical protein BKA59DRAFT_464210 [Fusarium tricinctum]